MSSINQTEKAIILPRGGLLWVHNHSGVNKNYIIEYMTNPKEFKGSPTSAAKILKSIEAFHKYQEKLMQDNNAKLNSILSTSPHE